MIAARNITAVFALIAGVRDRSFFAIEGLRQDTCNGRLSNTPNTGKEISMMETARLDRILKRPRDMFLTQNLFKGLRAILSGYYLIRHDIFGCVRMNNALHGG